MSASELPEPLRRRWEAAEPAIHTGAAASPEQSRLLWAILAAFPAESALRAEIEPIPTHFRAAPEMDAVGTEWLAVRARSTGEPADDAIAHWMCHVAAGAFREASHILGLPDLLGNSVAVARSDGEEPPQGSGLIGQPFGRPLYSPAEVRARVAASLEEVGIPTKVTYLEPFTVVPVFTLRLTDPPAQQEQLPLAQLLLGDVSRYEAWWVTVQDATGRVTQAQGADMLTGSGTGTGGRHLIWPLPSGGPRQRA